MTLAAPLATALTCSSNLTAECLGTKGVVVTFPLETHAPASRCEPPSGTLFLPGATVVRCIAWDSEGQTNTCKFVVTVVDVSQPQLESPGTIVAPTDLGGCSATAVALGLPQARNFDAPVSLTNDAPAEFLKGTNLVTWLAVDSLGNHATCQQIVIVRDEQPPVMVLPPAKLMPVPAGRSSVHCATLENPIVTDNCSGAQSTNDAPIELGIGSHLIRWTATDADGNTASGEQQVMVVDTHPPLMDCPSDIALPAGGGRTFLTNVSLGRPIVNDNHAVAMVTNDATALYGPGRDWWWVDPISGDDAEVQRGDYRQAFRTLGAALATAQDGDTIVMMPGTNFIRCAFLGHETPELLITRSNLSIFGRPGATLVATNLGDGVLCAGAANLKMQGLTLVGFRTNDDAVPFRLWAGIHVLGGCEGAEISGNRLDNWMNQGIAVLNGDPSTSTNVWVHDNYITRCGFVWRTTNGFFANRFDGAAIVPDAGWLVESNRIEDCAITIEVYPPDNLGFRAPPCVVRNNFLTNNLTGICGGNNRCPVNISGNTVVNDTNYAWIVDTSFNPWVGMGNLEGWFPCGVAFQGNYDGLVVTNNTLVGWRIGIGALDGALTNSIFNGNFISKTWQAGILLGDATFSLARSSNIEISGNILTNATSPWSGYGAISVYCAADTVIAGNSISGDYSEGISVYCSATSVSSNIVIRDTRLEGVFGWGLVVWDGTLAATVSRTAFGTASFRWGRCYNGLPAVAMIEGAPTSPPPMPPAPAAIDLPWAFPQWEELMEDDSLARFPVGTNIVRWTAIDLSGNSATCSQQIIVLSLEPDPVECPRDLTVEASSNCTAMVNYPLPDTDTGSSVTCLPAPGSLLPVGTNAIKCWITESSGQSNACAFQITVTEARPNLSFQRSPGESSYLLFWPETCTEWVLESCDSAAGRSEWTPVAAAPTTLNGLRQVLLPATGGQRFFRLRQP